jgi:hypothetical protein
MEVPLMEKQLDFCNMMRIIVLFYVLIGCHNKNETIKNKITNDTLIVSDSEIGNKEVIMNLILNELQKKSGDTTYVLFSNYSKEDKYFKKSIIESFEKDEYVPYKKLLLEILSDTTEFNYRLNVLKIKIIPKSDEKKINHYDVSNIALEKEKALIVYGFSDTESSWYSAVIFLEKDIIGNWIIKKDEIIEVY